MASSTVDLRSCQADEKGLTHGDTAGDAVMHYLGCLKDNQREPFLNELSNPANQKIKPKILKEEERIRKLRGILEAEGQTTASGQLLHQFKTMLRSRQQRPRQQATGRDTTSNPPANHNPQTNAASSQLSGVIDKEEERKRDKQFILDDMNANVIYFKKQGEEGHLGPFDHPKFAPSTFPDQKVPLSRLLKDDPIENPLMWECEKDMIRYFHIPANNMEWIEEVIARYYREATPDLSGPYRKPRTTAETSKTRMLLRPQFWKGLQHGGRVDLPTHTRHMRPRCYPISTNYENVEQPKNIALFMPYLHWETDRRRSRAAEVVMRYGRPLFQLADTVEDIGRSMVITATFERTTSDGFLEKTTQFIEPSQNEQVGPKIITIKSYDRGKKPLGILLLLAAKLYEEMDSYTDEKIIVHYLKSSSPLHPRRTLDQSYYWTLRDTRRRDRDQVVYRGTTPHPKLLRHDCPDKFDETKKRTAPCAQCQENVKKVSRVVMVDQLWMWILDENTIITSFPKRLGRNKPDISAVSKCIRTRLRQARIDEVRSVYDLGIIIIEECSRVFFHRTQSQDLQPQVMDAFANAIGRVVSQTQLPCNTSLTDKTHKQSIAFDHFWECTRLASKRYASRGQPDHGTAEKSQNVLLDIHPEGELLREMKDIIDEISIMVQLKKQEEQVARTFTKQVKTLIQKPEPNLFEDESRVQQEPGASSRRFIRGGTIHSKYPTLPEDYKWTMLSADELMEGFGDQIQELERLKEAAENASLGLKDLLDLKQQQASVIEAREAVKQGEETLLQARAIMLFTVITIIFLPLSFFGTLFGMNVTDGQKWTYRDVFEFMIPISVIVIFGSLCLAFSELVRAFLSLIFNVTWTKIITVTPMYVFWRKSPYNSKWLHESRKMQVNKMKNAAKKRVIDKKEEERIAKERKDNEINGTYGYQGVYSNRIVNGIENVISVGDVVIEMERRHMSNARSL